MRPLTWQQQTETTIPNRPRMMRAWRAIAARSAFVSPDQLWEAVSEQLVMRRITYADRDEMFTMLNADGMPWRSWPVPDAGPLVMALYADLLAEQLNRGEDMRP